MKTFVKALCLLLLFSIFLIPFTCRGVQEQSSSYKTYYGKILMESSYQGYGKVLSNIGGIFDNKKKFWLEISTDTPFEINDSVAVTYRYRWTKDDWDRGYTDDSVFYKIEKVTR